MLKDRAVDTAALTPVGRALAFPDVPEGLLAANARLREVAEERWPFDPDHLVSAAKAATGLSDYPNAPPIGMAVGSRSTQPSP